MEAKVLSSYYKQANNNNDVSVKTPNFLHYEGANKEQTVAIKASHGVGAQYYVQRNISISIYT